jgi:hypothetical protein
MELLGKTLAKQDPFSGFWTSFEQAEFVFYPTG